MIYSRDDCNAIITTSSNVLLLGCNNTLIPEDVRTIGSYAFSGRTAKFSITIPNTVTSIGGGAFSNCSGLFGITLPTGLTKIENYTFMGCKSLESVNIPNNVTIFGVQAFQNCSALTEFTFPPKVVSLASQSFINCSNIHTYDFSSYIGDLDENGVSNGTIPTLLASNVFGGTHPAEWHIVVPARLLDKFKSDNNWKAVDVGGAVIISDEQNN